MSSKVVCVRPSCFGYNPDTAATNSFQTRVSGDVQEAALSEFDAMVAKLRAADIDVIVEMDCSAGTDHPTPDSIFPNNWFSTHEDNNTLVLYPMCGMNRRYERNGTALDTVKRNAKTVIDMTWYEAKGEFLEGTGSLVLDREKKLCYAAISPRTHMQPVVDWCNRLGYSPITFTAKRSVNGETVYHTNVLMSVGPTWVVCALAMITDPEEQKACRDAILNSDKQLVEITEEQVNAFCGNVLSVKNSAQKDVTVMSTTAEAAFTPEQKSVLGTICAVHIPTIEKVGGGSARCMLAEVYF